MSVLTVITLSAVPSPIAIAAEPPENTTVFITVTYVWRLPNNET